MLCAALCTVLAGGCEDDLRVPYIPPTLTNWPQPYRGVAGLKVHIFNTGYRRVPEALLLRGGSLTRKRDLAVPAVLIEHPHQGLVLFNTGLNPKAKDTSPAGEWLTAVLGAEVLPGKDLATQMRDAGFKPEAVHWIILSNLRSDRAGEIESFPNARVVVTKVEHEYAQRGTRGYDTSMFDDVGNWKFIDFASTTGVATFPVHVDLFGDGSCLLLDASGSTPGALAVLVRLPQQPLLLADGFAAVEEQVRYAAKPAATADLRDWWDHIWRLKRFKDLVPDLIVVPGHDLGSVAALHAHDIVVHAFAPPHADTAPTPTAGVLERIIPRPIWPRTTLLRLLVLHAGAPTGGVTGRPLLAGLGGLCTSAVTAATAVGHAASGRFDGLVGVRCRCSLLRCLGLLRAIFGTAHADLNCRNHAYNPRNDQRSFHWLLQSDQRQGP